MASGCPEACAVAFFSRINGSITANTCRAETADIVFVDLSVAVVVDAVADFGRARMNTRIGVVAVALREGVAVVVNIPAGRRRATT